MIKLDEAKSWKNRFQEKLVDITEFQDFEDVLNDERLKTFMNTSLGDLEKISNEAGMNYAYLWGESENKDITMKEYLEDIYNTRIRLVKEKRIKFYISENKDIQGLIFYTISRPHFTTGEVAASNLSFFSFDLKKNQITLIRDTYSLLKDLIKNYAEVRWNALVDNPACEMYKKICDRLGGSYSTSKDTPGVIYFEILGNPLLERFSNHKQELLFREKGILDLDEELLNE